VTFPDAHLADEAIAAYVDDGLSPVARLRAERHLRCCRECRAVVEAQREAKVLLAGAPDPDLPTGLLARLRDIPMTADLGRADILLVMNAQGLAWATLPAGAAGSGEPRLSAAAGPVTPARADAAAESAGAGSAGAVSAGGAWSVGADGLAAAVEPVGSAAAAVGSPGSAAPPAAGSGRRPSGPGGDRRGARPRSYPSTLSARPLRRGRRRLAGALAGIAFGVIASAASTTAPNAAAPAGGGGAGGGSVPVVQPGGPSSAGTLEINTFRGGPDRRESGLLPVSRRGR
jgi:hypothetical protein